jgi:tRNA nucleotidyltransferase (CCA-adding enzyme)
MDQPPDAGPFAIATSIARAVREHGGRALVVGGWVRDRVLGRPSKDLDLEIYGVEPRALTALLARFGEVEPVGQSFPVFKVRGLDVALPRRESKAGRGHKGFIVRGDPSMPIEEAARRRDFTMNALLFDPLTGDYVDPFGGRDDLARRVLRAVDPQTFPDDSLRALRAVQFAARFELTIEPQTVMLCRAMQLDDLPPERIWGEIEKWLLLAERPSLGFEAARELGVLAQIFPEMVPLIGCPQEPDWHPEGDVWVHTLMVVDGARARIRDLPRAAGVAVMLGAVCHDLGKPATTATIDGRIRSPNHEDMGVAPTIALLDRLNLHSLDGFDVRTQVVGLVANHLKPGMWHKVRNEVGDGAFRRLAQKVDLELLARVAKADCLGRTGSFDCSAMDWFLDRARALGVEHKPPAPLLMGRHLLELGVKPGPQVGRILREMYELQLDGQITTLDEARERARHRLSDTPA